MSNVIGEREETRSPVGQVKDHVQDAAAQAKGQTREQLRSQVGDRSTQVGEQLSSTAQAVRRAAAELRDEGKEGPAKLVDGLAGRGERLGSYLSHADGDQLLRDVEELGRKQPWLFVGASAVVGFLASRFMKASSRSRYQSQAVSLPASTPPRERPAQPRLSHERQGAGAPGGVAGGLG
jgi:ElaB/YqjD/DUF883 family membrane-anchored ribosome-binding protein